MKSYSLKTDDDYTLSVTLFEPEISNRKLLIINSATGVRQQVYFSFAKYLTEKGFTVLSYDYRGIGQSKPGKMRGFVASMRIWGTLDYKAVTDFVQQQFHDFEKYALGHSVGALILGMNPYSHIFKKFVFVSTQKAFLGNLDFRTRIFGYLGFGVVQPLTTALFGYFPAHRFGVGESLPAGSAYDWRTLVLNRKSTNKLLEKIENDCSAALKQEVLVIRAEDDSWLTERAVRKLMEETFPNMRPTYRLVHTAESERGEIGHINFFRTYNRKLWKMVPVFLD